jgi:hypothetical protein
VHVLASGTLGTCSFDLDLLEYFRTRGIWEFLVS